MYKLSAYSNNYSKTSGRLYQYCRDEPALDNIGAIVYFTNDNTTDLLKFKEKITKQVKHGIKS